MTKQEYKKYIVSMANQIDDKKALNRILNYVQKYFVRVKCVDGEKINTDKTNQKENDVFIEQGNNLAVDVISELKQQLQGELKALQGMEKRAQELVMLLRAEQVVLQDILKEDKEHI